MNVRFLPEAEVELDETVKHYDQKSPGLGIDFAREVQRGLDRIADYPRAWQSLGRRVRRYSLQRFPYGLVYALNGAEIVIISVMYLRRDPDYWRDRLPKV